MERLLGAVLKVGVLSSVGWPVHQQGGHLYLTDRVEGDNPNVCVWEGSGGVCDLVQHLASVVAAEHGQLVHGPVPAK